MMCKSGVRVLKLSDAAEEDGALKPNFRKEPFIYLKKLRKRVFSSAWTRMESDIVNKKQVEESAPRIFDGGKEKHHHRWRGRCGCLRTSDKLRKILSTFPPPPPPPTPVKCDPCILTFCPQVQSQQMYTAATVKKSNDPFCVDKEVTSRYWHVLFELVQLIQLSVTATALALYYLIYCYMQVVYFTLKSALYFHQADGPMKITIAVVTVTSVVVAFNLIMRLDKLTR
ncbi:hypothetical protein evm_012828 [Chilo suppressalis]|nr:hypothetical protein evm_012828 [Chilo suppressalis]